MMLGYVKVIAAAAILKSQRYLKLSSALSMQDNYKLSYRKVKWYGSVKS